jgi:dTMP kinase
VRQEFLQIARLDPERYLVIDGTQSIEQIHSEIINRVLTIPSISHEVKVPKLKKTIKKSIKKPVKKSAKKK